MVSCSGFTIENRLDNWKRILGIEDSSTTARFESVSAKDTQKNSKTRVINQDVLRTRADEPFFRTTFVRSVLKQTLVRFCSFHRIEYLQGLNEILAPIFTLDQGIVEDIENKGSNLSSSSNDGLCDTADTNISHPFGLNLAIFERMMIKLSPTTFSTLGMNAIQVQLTTFHLLLMYHEPILATILRKEGMTPDIYAMSWLITLFARRQPVSRALHIWDILLQLDCPQITVYLAVALLRSRKENILNHCADILPATLVALKFESDEEIDRVFEDAIHLLHNTPANVTDELAELGFSVKIPETMRERGLKDLWHRPCVLSSASEVAQHIAFAEHSIDLMKRPARSPRYLVLDCRLSAEQQVHDALYIEGSVSIPHIAQEEICALARTKSILLDHDDMDMGTNADAGEIERTFARAVGGLSTRAAAVLALLWASFVSGTSEEVHFAIADDSKGPYLCTEEAKSPLNTSYALPFHTACGVSDHMQQERRLSEDSKNLPQYMTNSSVVASNSYAIALASALVTLGFPRVSIVQAEVLHRRRHSSHNESSMFTLTENNSISSLPIVQAETRSSGFASLLHYLSALGINSTAINAKCTHVQTPVDHFKEYQVAAFVHELRSTAIKYEHIDTDFYAEDLSTQSVSTPRPEPSHSHVTTPGTHMNPPTQTFSSISLVGTVLNASASNRNGPELRKSSSGGALSSMASTFSLMNPGISPRPVRRPSKVTMQDPLSQSLCSGTATGGSASSGLTVSTSLNSSGLSTTTTLMQAKLSCTLDVLFRLLLIMSAQKKHHISRLVVGSFFHSSVPIGRNHSPVVVSPRYEDSTGTEGYAHLLGAAPAGDDPLNNNWEYYVKLEKLLTLRDTLQELVNAQRLNTALDKNATKLVSKLRVLKNCMDHTNRQASRAAAVLGSKTTLRSTQRRLKEEAEAYRSGNRSRGDSTGSGVWQTSKDLNAFFHQEEHSDSRSSSALRDSLSTDWDNTRVLSEDSIDNIPRSDLL